VHAACSDADCESTASMQRAGLRQRCRHGGPRCLRGRAPPSCAPPNAQGGLAGLLLRLRQDGHGELCAVGPPGLAAAVHGLRHFATWRHPAASLSECGDHFARPVVYEVRPLPVCPVITTSAAMHYVGGRSSSVQVLHQGRLPIHAAA